MSRVRHKTDPDLEAALRKRAELNQQIEELKQLPEKLKKEQEDRMNTLPPFDLLEHKKREKAFVEKVSIGEYINIRRDLTRSSMVTVLLLITAVVLVWWAYRELLRLGLI